MRKFILPAVAAAAFGLAFLLPSHAQASWLSEALHRANGDYYNGGYNYATGYVAAPDYSTYYSPDSNYYSPGGYNYVPPVTYGYSSYGSYPSYYPNSYGGYSSYGSYPSYRGEWHGDHEHGEHFEHGGRYEHGGHNDHHDSGNHGRHR